MEIFKELFENLKNNNKTFETLKLIENILADVKSDVKITISEP